MTPEQTCFLQLLRDYVHGRLSTLPSFDVDWIKVARYAQEQSLSSPSAMLRGAQNTLPWEQSLFWIVWA